MGVALPDNARVRRVLARVLPNHCHETFPTPTWTPMYEAPKLEKFGTFRELTLARNPNNTKRVIGDDLIPGIGMDCDGNAPQGDPKACIRS